MNKRYFREIIDEINYSISPEAVEKLERFVEMIKKSSLSLNLLSSGEINHIWERHILDSLWPLILGVLEPPCSVLDVGSGAGFPGLPIAISAEGVHVTMIESVGKKARFVERIINNLGLKNADIVNCRIENFKPQKTYDYCTSRAFASISKSLPIFSRFINKDGENLFFKGPDVAREISEAEEFREELSLSVPQIIEIPAKYSSRGFNLVVYKRL